MSTIFRTDVLIVGGGPAGTSTALGLLKYSNLKVCIIEQHDLDTIRVGEQVDASLFDLLDYLGITRADFKEDSFLPSYGSFASWGSPTISSRHSVFSTQTDSLQLNRSQFDLLLLEKSAERGGIVLPRTKALAFHRVNGCWQANLRHVTKGDFTIEAQYLVDASGRQSHVGRKLGVHLEKFDDLVAVGAYLYFKAPKTIEQLGYLEAVEDGWWYLAALPNQQIVATLFTDADIVKEKQLQKIANWGRSLANTNYIKHKTQGAVLEDKLWVRNAFSHIQHIQEKPNFLAVGDAAASFDPISSMGIGFAISSACHAAKAIIDHAQDPDALMHYQKAVDAIFNAYLETKSNIYQKEQRWKHAPFWKSRVFNVQRHPL